MSHVSKIELEIKDLEALKAACQRLGVKFREGQKTRRKKRDDSVPLALRQQ